MSFDLSTNLSALPYGLFQQLANHFDANPTLCELLFEVVGEGEKFPKTNHEDSDVGIYALNRAELKRYRRLQDPGANLLRRLGTRGQTVRGLLARLHSLAKLHGAMMDEPQLILHRKFCSVIWSRPEQIVVSVLPSDHSRLKLQCKASGFPTPRYQWLEAECPIEEATSSTLVILRCACTARSGHFRCRVWNEVEADREWSAFYRANGKHHASELLSDPVNLDRWIETDTGAGNVSSVNSCAACSKSNLEKNIFRQIKAMSSAVPTSINSAAAAAALENAIISGGGANSSAIAAAAPWGAGVAGVASSDVGGSKSEPLISPKPSTTSHLANDGDDPMLTTVAFADEIIAADKVALIIANRTYAPLMANLITPFCDAETLADALQQLQFKTVTLGDLRLEEMRFMIQEYKKLLGDGVYAVFYFVGHGFEANGQCYLLPIGAPTENYGPEDCLSMDWVMSEFRAHNPALNLVLLDICRKFLPSNLDAFLAYAESFRSKEATASSTADNNIVVASNKVNRNTVYGYATSGGVGAYEVKGELNGVFMKYLKNRIGQRLTVIDMLNRVLRDVEKDKKVCDVQIPELRSNLTKPRSLVDPLIFDGHTSSYEHHTLHWRTMHELPTPVHVEFTELELLVTVWFDFCGHFTNKVYVFSSVGDMSRSRRRRSHPQNAGTTNKNNIKSTATEAGSAAVVMDAGGNEDREESDDDDEALAPSTYAQSHLAYLRFVSALEASSPKVCADDEEGISLCTLVSNLQRCAGGELHCVVELRRIATSSLSPRESQKKPNPLTRDNGNKDDAKTISTTITNNERNLAANKDEDARGAADGTGVLIASKDVCLGHVLITRLLANSSSAALVQHQC